MRLEVVVIDKDGSVSGAVGWKMTSTESTDLQIGARCKSIRIERSNTARSSGQLLIVEVLHMVTYHHPPPHVGSFPCADLASFSCAFGRSLLWLSLLWVCCCRVSLASSTKDVSHQSNFLSRLTEQKLTPEVQKRKPKQSVGSLDTQR